MSADIECTSPPCMNTAYGWGIFHKSSCCCRSHRKSSSAWRPCFSSASVSAALCRTRRRPKQTALCYCICDVNSQTFTCRESSQNYFCVCTSPSGGSEESKVLWWIASHLHQWTRSTHQLSNDHQLFSEVLPSHPTAGLSPDGETDFLKLIQYDCGYKDTCRFLLLTEGNHSYGWIVKVCKS